MGQVNRALAFLSEACQLAHLLRARAHDDGDGDVIEREVLRRVFWHVYAVDMYVLRGYAD